MRRRLVVPLFVLLVAGSFLVPQAVRAENEITYEAFQDTVALTGDGDTALIDFNNTHGFSVEDLRVRWNDDSGTSTEDVLIHMAVRTENTQDTDYILPDEMVGFHEDVADIGKIEFRLENRHSTNWPADAFNVNIYIRAKAGFRSAR